MQGNEEWIEVDEYRLKRLAPKEWLVCVGSACIKVTDVEKPEEAVKKAEEAYRRMLEEGMVV